MEIYVNAYIMYNADMHVVMIVNYVCNHYNYNIIRMSVIFVLIIMYCQVTVSIIEIIIVYN